MGLDWYWIDHARPTGLISVNIAIANITGEGGGEEIVLGISEQIRTETSAKILHAQRALKFWSFDLNLYIYLKQNSYDKLSGV